MKVPLVLVEKIKITQLVLDHFCDIDKQAENYLEKFKITEVFFVITFMNQQDMPEDQNILLLALLMKIVEDLDPHAWFGLTLSQVGKKDIVIPFRKVMDLEPGYIIDIIMLPLLF